MEDLKIFIEVCLQVLKMYWLVIPATAILCWQVNKLSEEESNAEDTR